LRELAAKCFGVKLDELMFLTEPPPHWLRTMDPAIRRQAAAIFVSVYFIAVLWLSGFASHRGSVFQPAAATPAAVAGLPDIRA
jgi:hypothetical protein